MDRLTMNMTFDSDAFRLFSGRAFESSDSIGKSYKLSDAFKNSTVNMYFHVRPGFAPGKIFDLGVEDIKLKEPLDIIYKIYPGEVLALFPELELVGEGANEMQALEDLKCEILELHEYIADIPDNKLGKYPKAWKNILQRIIRS